MEAVKLDHCLNRSIVRSYDIRGRVGEELTEEDTVALGLAFATVALARGLRNLAVCRDGRLSSPALEGALIRGLICGGARVHPLGLGPTPLLHFGVRAASLDGGVMVTASHNPRDDNGFKLLLNGDPVYGTALQQLVATKPMPCSGGELHDGASRAQIMLRRRYVEYLASIAEEAPFLQVVWDCGNGAVGAVMSDVASRIPGRHTLLNSRVDGRFPAHHPDPSVAGNLAQLQAAVRGSGADLGIAFDGDGDRIGVVDSDGEIVWPDQLLLLLAIDILTRSPGATIVGDVKSSQLLFEGVSLHGGSPVMAPSGYVLVREVMQRHNAQLAGEMSGHILFADCWHRTDDALFVALRLLICLGRLNLTLAEFRRSLKPAVATPEIRIACIDRRKSAILEEVATRLRSTHANVDATDGLRVTTEHGWWLLRRSGTESKITVRCESHSAQGLEILKRELASQLRQSGVQVGDLL
jgi:phosphomannomutase